MMVCPAGTVRVTTCPKTVWVYVRACEDRSAPIQKCTLQSEFRLTWFKGAARAVSTESGGRVWVTVCGEKGVSKKRGVPTVRCWCASVLLERNQLTCPAGITTVRSSPRMYSVIVNGDAPATSTTTEG